ncbi:hypothetical protein GYMLUDRAFT_991516 [Collybiopsis luxurians FD-317 M1]|uniref:Methyltransferase domain-containing protein n=1 Tax=Collybiopsis luxurians FD-317 M1 TaxID=944289 RepID=A0A0D0BFG2_9AGAR|nr:hypothetical protein GYMLUDRAFT_991516 [Collybiopsis luxurians FD-317 M1]
MTDQTVILDALRLGKEELAFYQKATGIQDQDKLQEHIIQVAKKALEIYPYHCISTFGFIRFRIRRSQSSYTRLLELGSSRPDALLLDLGCCFGNDLRIAVEDGYPVHNVIASDLRAGYWELGHELFNSTSSTFPVPFIAGDVFDEAFLSIRPPFRDSPDYLVDVARSILRTKPQTLNFLRGHLSAIHASAFFHLWKEEGQLTVAKKLASLLSPVPGSIIFGSQLGSVEPYEEVIDENGNSFYRHSPTSWKDMWEREVFGGEGLVTVEAGIHHNASDASGDMLWWIVTRV